MRPRIARTSSVSAQDGKEREPTRFRDGGAWLRSSVWALSSSATTGYVNPPERFVYQLAVFPCLGLLPGGFRRKSSSQTAECSLILANPRSRRHSAANYRAGVFLYNGHRVLPVFLSVGGSPARCGVLLRARLVRQRFFSNERPRTETQSPPYHIGRKTSSLYLATPRPRGQEDGQEGGNGAKPLRAMNRLRAQSSESAEARPARPAPSSSWRGRPGALTLGFPRLQACGAAVPAALSLSASADSPSATRFNGWCRGSYNHPLASRLQPGLTRPTSGVVCGSEIAATVQRRSGDRSRGSERTEALAK